MSTPPVDPKTYTAFIRQIELRDLWLIDAQIHNYVGPSGHRPEGVDVGDRATFDPIDGGFVVEHSYRFRFGEGDFQEADEDFDAVIVMTFGIGYQSEIAMSDELFKVFAENNLRLNTWPFAREFVSTTLGRIGWTPISIPAFKLGGPKVEEKPEDQVSNTTDDGKRRSPRSKRSS